MQISSIIGPKKRVATRRVAIMIVVALIVASCSDGTATGTDPTTTLSEQTTTTLSEQTTTTLSEQTTTTLSEQTTVDAPPEFCDPTDPIDVRSGTTGFTIASLPWELAVDAGILEKYGINMSYQNLSRATMPALLNGDIDIAVTALVQVFSLRNEGREAVAWAATSDRQFNQIVVTRELYEAAGLTDSSSWEEKARAFEGSTIAATSPGGGTDSQIRTVVAGVGIDPETEMGVVYMDSGSMLPAFAQRRIDGFVFGPPLTAQAVLQHDGVVLFNLAKNEFPGLADLMQGILLSRSTWLAANGEAATCISLALEESLKLIASDIDEAKRLYAEHSEFGKELDDATLDLSIDMLTEAFPDSPYIDVGDQSPAQRTYDSDVIRRGVDQPLENHIDNTANER